MVAPKTKIIIIKAEATGTKDIKRITRAMGNLNKSTKKTADVMVSARRAFTGIFAAFAAFSGVSVLTRMADDLQLLTDRMRVFSNEGDDVEANFNKLTLAANYTKTSIGSLGTVYNRMVIATKELGLSSDATLASTVALQQTFRLSGATIAEATASAIQLTQGLSSGQLRGQELRSVMEANGVFAGILAKQFGIARGQLIKFAEAGKITSKEVLTALSKNAKELNRQADGLGQTFEQTGKIIANEFSKKINDANKFLGLNTKVAALAAAAMNHFSTAMQHLAATVLPLLIIGVGVVISKMWLAVAAFAAANPILTGIVVALNLVVIGINSFLGGFTNLALQAQRIWTEFKISLYELVPSINEVATAVDKAALKMKFLFGNKEELKVRLELADEAFNKSIAKNKTDLRGLKNDLGEIQGKILQNRLEREAENKGILETDKLINALANDVSKIKPVKTFFKFNIAKEIQKVNEAFQTGLYTVSQYKNAINELKLEELEDKFSRGKVTVSQYNAGITALSDTVNSSAFFAGVDGYIKSAGTLAQGIAGGITNVFTRLEDSLLEFIKTGKFQFKEFASAVLDDINRIIIRALIVKPLAAGILNALPTGVSSGPKNVPAGTQLSNSQFANATVSAKGNAFDGGNLLKFARGGVVDQPTAFSFGGGKRGLMGEAGSEAILPLTRAKTGNLGVEASGLGSNVTVNIVNQAGDTETETRESTNQDGSKVIDILILQKTQEAIATGQLDKTFNQAFGLKRRGM